MFRNTLPALACVGLSSVAAGASAADEPIDEIVVTADFRNRGLAELAASVTVLGADVADRAALQHFEELALLVPNLNWAGGSNRARYFQIRGIGERSQYEGAPNPSVGFIIDDVDFSGIGGIAMTWDIEQVEVLRGPQATRYGANALAGLVHVRSRAPGDTFDARARAEVGGDGMRGVALALGGPVSEQFGYRVSARQFQGDGFRDNAFLGRSDTNERDERQLRARFTWEPRADTLVDATALWVDQDNGYDAFAIDNSLTTQSDRPGRDAQRSAALALRATHDAGDRWSVTSITGVARSDIEFSFDADWGSAAFWDGFFAAPPGSPFTPVYDYFSRRDRERDTLSQEFRLLSGPASRLFGDSTDWLVGIYGLRTDEALVTRDEGAYSDGSFAPFLLDAVTRSDYRSTRLALFGQLDSDLGAATRLSAGIRVERRGADYTDSSGLAVSPDESMIGGHVSLTHDWTDAVSGFVSLGRGYKAGGFNLGPVPKGRREFDAEFLWNVEAGLRVARSDWSASIVAFYARRIDQQVDTSFQLVPNDPSSFVFFQDNAARGRNLGLEAEWRAALGTQLSVYANVGLLRAEFASLETPEVNLSGREQAHAPGYTFAVGGEWRHPRGWFARADITGKDEFYFSNSHDERSAAYELVNLRAGYTREHWSVTLWARNAFDRRYAVRGFFFGNEPPDFPDRLYLRLGDPRQAGITIDWRY
jgi:outer membrane receptor protein involved in Fe transport